MLLECASASHIRHLSNEHVLRSKCMTLHRSVAHVNAPPFARMVEAWRAAVNNRCRAWPEIEDCGQFSEELRAVSSNNRSTRRGIVAQAAQWPPCHT